MTSLVIHNDNIVDFGIFTNDIKLPPIENIDQNISDNILAKVNELNPEIIFIKDNLSENYLELYGLRVAYHIRLSSELSSNRYLPIVIISDLDSYMLNKLESLANILFTKNIFIIKHTKEAIEKVLTKSFRSLSSEEYQSGFLNRIEVEQPKDYLSHHSIANEWSMYRWANFLKIEDSESIKKNKEKIEGMLYFKYLKVKYQIIDLNKNSNIQKLSQEGKVLFIDDEWDKGWSDILKVALESEKTVYETFEYNYKDKSEFNLFNKIKNKLNDFNPDVVILDLRLSENDHNENRSIDDFLGMDILKKIHEINAGIQVVMLTATSQSTILEELYEKKILGYVKKGHPNDTSLDAVESINKLISLVDQGLNKKYLKEIWILQQDILKLNLFNLDNENYEKIYFELSNIFDLLDSSISKKTTFFMLAIYNSIEIIVKEFNYRQGSTYSSITSICRQLELLDIDMELSKIICTRNYLIHLIDANIRGQCIENTVKIPTSENLIDWLNIIYSLLKEIDKQTK